MHVENNLSTVGTLKGIKRIIFVYMYPCHFDKYEFGAGLSLSSRLLLLSSKLSSSAVAFPSCPLSPPHIYPCSYHATMLHYNYNYNYSW
jgi:hypothetical protein